MQLINALGTAWKKSVKANLIKLSIYDHHLINNNQIFSLNKLSRKELYIMQIIKNVLLNLTTTFFCTTNLYLRKIYVLSHKTTINKKLHVFKYEILDNMLYLNKMLFRFWKVNLHYVPFVSHLQKQQFLCSAFVHFNKIFGHKLNYSF